MEPQFRTTIPIFCSGQGVTAVGWWKQQDLHGELEAVLALISEARGHISMDEERASRKLFDALSRAWNAFRRFAPDLPDSDWQALKALKARLRSGSRPRAP
jgi:hypothetical protein